MGTRATVRFPEYKIVGYEYIKPIYSSIIGNVYVYLGFDGDELPEYMRQVLIDDLDKDGYNTEPEVLASQLIEALLLENNQNTVRVYGHEPPVPGYMLLVDCKSRTVTYKDGPTYTFQQFVKSEEVEFTTVYANQDREV